MQTASPAEMAMLLMETYWKGARRWGHGDGNGDDGNVNNGHADGDGDDDNNDYGGDSNDEGG